LDMPTEVYSSKVFHFSRPCTANVRNLGHKIGIKVFHFSRPCGANVWNLGH